MVQRFCTRCGAQVDAGSQSFCTTCGAPIEAGEPQLAGAQAEGRRLDGFDTPAAGDWEAAPGQYAPYDAPGYQYGGNTAQIPPASPVPPVPPVPPKRVNPIVIAAIVAAFILLAAVAYALLAPHDSKPGTFADPGPSTTTASIEEPPSESSSVASSSVEEVDEDAVYDELVDIYDAMGTQADRIKNVAGTLNNTVFTADKQTRQNAAREAYDLQDEISAQMAQLKQLGSSYTGTRHDGEIETLIDLQEDLCKRIDVMCEAWDISLSYSNPKQHDAEILKPLARDNDSKGINVYKKDFESRYPDSRPTR